MANTATRIIHVAFVTRNNMDVRMVDDLAPPPVGWQRLDGLKISPYEGFA